MLEERPALADPRSQRLDMCGADLDASAFRRKRAVESNGFL
jgi:hypothetical protein